MKRSQISLSPYRARVRRLSKSQLPLVHRANNIRLLRIQTVKVSHISSAPQQLNKSDTQSAHHATTIDFQSASDIKLSRVKRIDLGDIQSIHAKKSWKSHIKFSKKMSFIQLTNSESTQSSRCRINNTEISNNIAPSKIEDHSNLSDQLSSKHKKRKKRRRASLLPWFLFCCLIGTILLLFALAAILIATLLPKSSVVTTMTSTTSASSTTTSMTSTSTTSTTSTSTISTTSTSTISTTSTSTASTTSTSTTTTMTTDTTTTTPVLPCQPTNISSSSALLSISSANSTGYTCYAYEWTALTTGTVTLAFQLRNDPSTWYLDDVSVYDGGTQMLVNGGFESGSLSPWVVTFPNGTCLFASPSGKVCNTLPHTGSYDYCDGCNSVADQISQSFVATAGQVYIVSFWLKTGSTGSVITALVTMQ